MNSVEPWWFRSWYPFTVTTSGGNTPQEFRWAANAASMRETPETYVLEYDLPGLSRDDIEIKVDDRSLTISAKTERKVVEGKYLLDERGTVDITRTFTLPKDADLTSVEAKTKDGVLTLVIRKLAGPVLRTIKIL